MCVTVSGLPVIPWVSSLVCLCQWSPVLWSSECHELCVCVNDLQCYDLLSVIIGVFVSMICHAMIFWVSLVCLCQWSLMLWSSECHHWCVCVSDLSYCDLLSDIGVVVSMICHAVIFWVSWVVCLCQWSVMLWSSECHWCVSVNDLSCYDPLSVIGVLVLMISHAMILWVSLVC